ncbi:MAG: hypothetical protein FK730_16425 [Asgard group archaeon]|nr:hypothetical protein [Asgard group archaeon]
MNIRRGVCLVRFDDTQGPGCLFSTGLEKQFAQKVCMKSHLSTLSLSSSQWIESEEYVESVIPFIDEGFIAYSTFFFVDDDSARGGKRTLGIVTLVDRSQQLSLYKSIPEIAATVREIASELVKQGDPKEHLSDQIKKRLKQLSNLESLAVNFDKGIDSIDLIKQRIDKEEQLPVVKPTSLVIDGSFEFLFSKIPENLDKVIFALLKNERIVIVGEKSEISLALATLKWFLPHKKLYNDLWTVPLVDAEALFSRSKESTTLHILGIQNDSFFELTDITHEKDDVLIFNDEIDQHKKSLKRMPLESKVIIDLNDGTIYSGLSNRFCEKLLATIKNKQFDRIIEIISEHIDYLITRVSDLTELVLNDAPTVRIQNFVDNSLDGELSLITTIINETNPKLMVKMLEIFSKNQLPLDVLF